jgi:hypothetical protein
MTTVLNPTTSDTRGSRAMALVASGALEHPVWLDAEHVQRLVPSCAREGAFYVTSIDSCTCADAKYRRAVCKHQQAVRLAAVLAQAEQENEQAGSSRLEVVA